MTKTIEASIATDLALCNLVMGTMGKRSRQYKSAKSHLAACFTEIHAWNVRDGLAEISADDLLAELAA